MKNKANLIFTCGVVGLLLLMVLPIPTFLLDLLLALNLTLGLTVLVVALNMERALDFSGFPAMLLVATLFRLTLNIASTRLILLKGYEGPESAGSIISTFGQFVVGGSYVVGVIVFVILVIINFIVITKGSGRIAEVGARFTLDAMPGKQMAIDADLNAGLINEDEARTRRKTIESEADFYGAMDGASKFVRGDAIAGILITVINIIGGLVIGVTQHGMEFGDAAQTYTTLTVGDGLVSQIPALVISTAAGIIVSRAASGGDLGSELATQLFSNQRVLRIVAVIMVLFGLLPGMPLIVFGGIALTMFLVARAVDRKVEDPEVVGESLALDGPAADGKPAEEKIEDLLPLDLLELHVGYALIPLVDRAQNGELLDRIQNIRRQLASSLGIIVPPIHIRDELQLQPGGYSVLIKGVQIAEGELQPDRYMAMSPGETAGTVDGVETVEPAFGMPAVWINPEQRDEAERLGYTVVDCSTVVATHLSEVLQSNCAELVGRQELQELLDVFAKRQPKVVEELVPDKLPLGEVLKVVKNLLREHLSVRDLRTILGGLADHIHLTKNPVILTEFVRQRLSKYICSGLRAPDGHLHVITLDSALSDHFRGAITQMDGDFQLNVTPAVVEGLLGQLEKAVGEQQMMGYPEVLLVAPELRRSVYNLLERLLPRLSVISHKEVAPGVPVTADATVGGRLVKPRLAPSGQLNPGLA